MSKSGDELLTVAKVTAAPKLNQQTVLNPAIREKTRWGCSFRTNAGALSDEFVAALRSY